MREVIVFGLVGIAATLTHYLSALLLIEWFLFGALQANLVAYLVAMLVSYVGHSQLTFRSAMTRGNLARFVAVSVMAMGLSQLILWGLTSLAWFGHRINMLVVVAFVPCFSFLMNKYWVYSSRRTAANHAVDIRQVAATAKAGDS